MCNGISRRRLILLTASSIVGISGCIGTSELNSSQSILIRNETTTQQVIDVILKNEGKNSEVVYESTFSVDPNEQIRKEDVVPASDYKYIVESDGLKSKDGIWRVDSDHRSNIIVIEIKKDENNTHIHVVTVGH